MTKKFASGVNVTIDGEMEFFNDMEFFEAINIPNTNEYKQARLEIIRNLVGFGRLDLSYAYPNHTVVLELVPV